MCSFLVEVVSVLFEEDYYTRVEILLFTDVEVLENYIGLNVRYFLYCKDWRRLGKYPYVPIVSWHFRLNPVCFFEIYEQLTSNHLLIIQVDRPNQETAEAVPNPWFGDYNPRLKSWVIAQLVGTANRFNGFTAALKTSGQLELIT